MKLVRNKIAKSFESNSDNTVVYLKGKKARVEALRSKLLEETSELVHEIRGKDLDKIIDELADVYEVLGSIERLYGLDYREVTNAVEQKSSKKGNFSKFGVIVDR